MHRRALLVLLTVVLLGTTACGADGGPVVSDDPIPVEPDGGIGDGAGPPGGQGVEDGPIPVEPDGGIGGEEPVLDEAPPFGVSSDVGSVVVPPSSWCWSSADAGVCADGFLRPEDHVLAVDDQLVVTYPPGELSFRVGPAFEGGDGQGFVEPDTELPFEQQADGIWLVSTAELEPGEYALHLFWRGEQGDSGAAVTLRVG